MGEGYLRPKIYIQYGIPAYAVDHVHGLALWMAYCLFDNISVSALRDAPIILPNHVCITVVVIAPLLKVAWQVDRQHCCFSFISHKGQIKGTIISHWINWVHMLNNDGDDGSVENKCWAPTEDERRDTSRELNWYDQDKSV